MAQITFIQHVRVNTDRYSMASFEDKFSLVCNECKDKDGLSEQIIATYETVSSTKVLAAIVRHEGSAHYATVKS